MTFWLPFERADLLLSTVIGHEGGHETKLEVGQSGIFLEVYVNQLWFLVTQNDLNG